MEAYSHASKNVLPCTWATVGLCFYIKKNVENPNIKFLSKYTKTTFLKKNSYASFRGERFNFRLGNITRIVRRVAETENTKYSRFLFYITVGRCPWSFFAVRLFIDQ
jgi:hypothetical protein